MQMATQIISVPSAFNCNPSPFMLWKNGIKLAKCSINFTPKIQKIQWKIALPGQFTWPIPLSPTFHGGLWKWWDRHKENAKPSSLNPTATSAARRSNKKDSHRSGYILDNQTKDKQNPGLCLLFWNRVYQTEVVFMLGCGSTRSKGFVSIQICCLLLTWALFGPPTRMEISAGQVKKLIRKILGRRKLNKILLGALFARCVCVRVCVCGCACGREMGKVRSGRTPHLIYVHAFRSRYDISAQNEI